MQSRASSFIFQYFLVSLRSSSSCLFLPVPSIFPSIMCFRSQLQLKMWPIQSASFRFKRMWDVSPPPFTLVTLLFVFGRSCPRKVVFPLFSTSQRSSRSNHSGHACCFTIMNRLELHLLSASSRYGCRCCHNRKLSTIVGLYLQFTVLRLTFIVTGK